MADAIRLRLKAVCDEVFDKAPHLRIQTRVVNVICDITRRDAFVKLLWKAWENLVWAFRECARFKVGAYDYLQKIWRNIQDDDEVVDLFFALFVTQPPAPEIDDAIIDALSESVVYFEIMRAVFEFFRETAAVHPSTPIVSTEVFDASESGGDAEALLDSSACAIGGAILCRFCKAVTREDNQELVDVIDRMSAHMKDLPDSMVSAFLKYYNQGFLRFPKPVVHAFMVEVRTRHCWVRLMLCHAHVRRY